MSDKKTLSTLQLTKNNPRTLSTEQSETMDRQLEEYGPLDGIVYNVNSAINELVTANQRTQKFRKAYDPEIIIDQRYDKPTKTGTVAEGHVYVDGERWTYREVDWPINKHKAGVVLANNAGGDNDLQALAEYSDDIDDVFKELMSVDFDALPALSDPFDDEGEPKADKPKEKKYSLEELRTLAKGIYPAQADVILDFLEAVGRASS